MCTRVVGFEVLIIYTIYSNILEWIALESESLVRVFSVVILRLLESRGLGVQR